MSIVIITLAAFIAVLAIAAMALMWVKAMRAAFDGSVSAEADRIANERFRELCETAEYHITADRYIVCGQGYHDQEDKITMTRAIELTAGAMYVHISGSVYKCLRTTADGCAVLMDINSGTLLTVRSVRAYQDGKIDYQIVECVRLAGAAV